jgi:hypothetical protein
MKIVSSNRRAHHSLWRARATLRRSWMVRFRVRCVQCDSLLSHPPWCPLTEAALALTKDQAISSSAKDVGRFRSLDRTLLRDSRRTCHKNILPPYCMAGIVKVELVAFRAVDAARQVLQVIRGMNAAFRQGHDVVHRVPSRAVLIDQLDEIGVLNPGQHQRSSLVHSRYCQLPRSRGLGKPRCGVPGPLPELRVGRVAVRLVRAFMFAFRVHAPIALATAFRARPCSVRIPWIGLVAGFHASRVVDHCCGLTLLTSATRSVASALPVREVWCCAVALRTRFLAVPSLSACTSIAPAAKSVSPAPSVRKVSGRLVHAVQSLLVVASLSLCAEFAAASALVRGERSVCADPLRLLAFPIAPHAFYCGGLAGFTATALLVALPGAMFLGLL